MLAFWKGFKKIAGITRKKLTQYDAFGQPIAINYKGEDNYKTFFGFIITAILTVVMLSFTYKGVDRLVNREEPDRSFIKMTNSRNESDALNLPEYGGQMYIGLQEKAEYKDGSTITTYIPFDKRFINVKIDYYNRSNLEARQDLQLCDPVEMEDFALKVNNTNGVELIDFPVMRCIPREKFNLHNVAGTPEVNSITLHFEQCGGKYAVSKAFPPTEQEIQKSIDENDGIIPPSAPEWEWTKPNCDPLVEDCGFPG